MSLATMPMPIDARPTSTEKVHCVGDSLMEGAGNLPTPGGYLAPLRWRIQSHQLSLLAPSGGWLSTDAHGMPSTLLTWTQSGHSGTTIADLNTNFSTWVTPYTPTILFIDVSPNDWGGAPGAWSTSMDAINTKLIALNPTCKLALIPSILGQGEKWSGGWGANTKDAQLATLNTEALTWATNAARSVYWFDIRGDLGSTGGTVWYYESINNPTNLTLGPIAPVDGEHPSITFGQKVISDLIWNKLSVTYA